MKLSILDYGLLDEGRTVAEAWQDSLSLAKRAEERGFHRFWLAEHHNVHALTVAAPEVLLTYLASHTKTIKLGTGGIMGLHYSPYKVAEVVASLTTLFPNRVDFGLGNSTGTALVKEHLRSQFEPSQFSEWMAKFLNYLIGASTVAQLLPSGDYPEIFTLGMGGSSLDVSSQLGLGYVYGSFPFIEHEPLAMAEALAKSYRQNFVPSSFMEKPHFILALFVVVADSDEEAENLAKSLDIWMLGKQDFNDFSQFPSLVTYQIYPLSQEEKERIKKQRSRMIIGTKEKIKAQIDAFIAVSQPDELMIIPLLAGIDNRLRAVDLLADCYQK